MIKITATVTIIVLIMSRMKTITTLKITKMTEASFQTVFNMSRMSRNLPFPLSLPHERLAFSLGKSLRDIPKHGRVADYNNIYNISE